MTAATLREQSADQIISQYLASISHLPVDRRLDAIAAMARQTIDSELRRPLIREFNNLSERKSDV